MASTFMKVPPTCIGSEKYQSQRGEMDRIFTQPGFLCKHSGPRTRVAVVALCLAIHTTTRLEVLATYAAKNPAFETDALFVLALTA
jgi:hypothetical protein